MRGEGGWSASLGFIYHHGLVLAAISDNLLEPSLEQGIGMRVETPGARVLPVRAAGLIS